MSGSYLLDTNIVIALFNGDLAVQKRLAGVPEAFLSIVTLGELFYGARGSVRVEENLSRIEAFAEEVTVLGCDLDTSRFYGILKAQLRRQGRPIPENDLWLAAVARRHDLTLVTRDGHHFEDIEGLQRDSW